MTGKMHTRHHLRHLLLDRDAFATEVATGATQQQLAASLGVSRNTIQRRMREWDLCPNGHLQGPRHCNWLGGRRLGKHGYVEIWCPLHPHAKRATKSIPEHRLVMEIVLGRLLQPQEVVHHTDGHPRHNWPANLALFPNNAAHLKAELTGRVKATRRPSIPGAYRSHQNIRHCPDAHETLGASFSEMAPRLAYALASFRPTLAHRTQTCARLLRSGAWRHPFGPASTASDT